MSINPLTPITLPNGKKITAGAIMDYSSSSTTVTINKIDGTAITFTTTNSTGAAQAEQQITDILSGKQGTVASSFTVYDYSAVTVSSIQYSVDGGSTWHSLPGPASTNNVQLKITGTNLSAGYVFQSTDIFSLFLSVSSTVLVTQPFTSSAASTTFAEIDDAGSQQLYYSSNAIVWA